MRENEGKGKRNETNGGDYWHRMVRRRSCGGEKTSFTFTLKKARRRKEGEWGQEAVNKDERGRE